MAAPLGATMAYSSNGPFGPFPSGTTVTAQCPSGQSIQGKKDTLPGVYVCGYYLCELQYLQQNLSRIIRYFDLRSVENLYTSN